MHQEFEAWLRDVKKTGMGGTKTEMRDLFRQFMEDYNTCTLPHEKYYNLDAYEAKELARRRRGGADDDDFSFKNDEAERNAVFRAQREAKSQEEAAALMRANPALVCDMHVCA